MKILEGLIIETGKAQDYFEIPSEDLLASLMRDYKSSHNQIKSLKEDYDYLLFVKACMQIQKTLLANFRKKIIPIADTTENENCTEDKIKSDSKVSDVIKGVKGLARFLNKGTTTAQDILNSGILQNEGIAYRVGNGWNINAEKLANLLAKKPDILSHRRR